MNRWLWIKWNERGWNAHTFWTQMNSSFILVALKSHVKSNVLWWVTPFSLVKHTYLLGVRYSSRESGNEIFVFSRKNVWESKIFNAWIGQAIRFNFFYLCVASVSSFSEYFQSFFKRSISDGQKFHGEKTVKNISRRFLIFTMQWFSRGIGKSPWNEMAFFSVLSI